MCLSMCETRIINLWTTIAALSKLPSLVELRFQNWLCCNDAGPSATSSEGRLDSRTDFGQSKSAPYTGASTVDIGVTTDYNSTTEEALRNLFSLNDVVTNHEAQSMIEDSSDDSDVDFSFRQQEHGYRELSSIFFPRLNEQFDQLNEVKQIVLSLKTIVCNHNAR